jgi:hypothetical protein
MLFSIRRLLSVVPPENMEIITQGAPDYANIHSLRDLEEGAVKTKKRRTRSITGEKFDILAVAPLACMDGNIPSSLSLSPLT